MSISTIIAIIWIALVLLAIIFYALNKMFYFVESTSLFAIYCIVAIVYYLGATIILNEESKIRHTVDKPVEEVQIYHFTKDELIYDNDTKIIYFKDSKTPYLSENGNICRYENGEVVEVTE